jgi:putative membrane protein
MIDFLAMDLIVLVISLVLVAWFFVKYIENDQQKVAPGFLATGFVATLSGLDIAFGWPLVGSYNIVFGEPLVFFGVLLFFTGVAVLKGWDLHTLGIFAVFAGVVAIILGIRMWYGIEITNKAGVKVFRGMTREPALAGISFILTGIGGILTLPAYLLRKNMVLRIIVAVLFLVAAVLFAIMGYGSYWSHPESFAGSKPHM